MEALLVLLLPFPLGWFTRDRLTAVVTYLAAFLFVFPFQTLSLLVDWTRGSTQAFGPFPGESHVQVFSYGLVNLTLYLIGFGLLFLGHRLGSRRRARRTAREVSLDPLG